MSASVSHNLRLWVGLWSLLVEVLLVHIKPLQMQVDVASVDDSAVYAFDGSQDSYVSFAEDFSFQPSLGFTITAWIQQDPGNEG